MATFTWRGGSGNWTDSNWSESSYPGYSDIAVIGGTGTYTVNGGQVVGVQGVTLSDPAVTLVAPGILVVGGTLQVSAGTLSLDTGGGTSISAALLDNGGTILSDGLGANASIISAGDIVNSGQIVVSGDRLTLGSLSSSLENSGTIAVANHGTLHLDAATLDSTSITLASGASVTLDAMSSATGGGAIRFTDGTAATLTIRTTNAGWQTLPSTIENFQAGNTIDLPDLAYTGSDWAYQNGTLTLPDQGYAIPLELAGAGTVSVGDDGSGRIAITTDAPCFAAGTRILTKRGMVPVEALRPGEPLALARGGTAPLVWLGYRRVDCRRHPRPHDVWPVHIAPGAFGANRPRRDLWLSPDHAVFFAGALIPIRYLVNGATIVQEPADGVTYWHVELPRHGVLLAEGLACESYLDTGNRGAFANAPGAVMMQPDFALRIWETQSCAKLVREGPGLARARRRLLRRATALGHLMTDDPDIRILADGRQLLPHVQGRLFGCRLPEATRRIQLLSRSGVPAHMCPDEASTQRLGIAVSQLWLDGREVSLDSPGLSNGWYDREAEAFWRWTDGNAELMLPNARVLIFEMAMTGIYWRGGANVAEPLVA